MNEYEALVQCHLHENIHPTSTHCNTGFTWTDLGANLFPQSEQLATECLSHGTDLCPVQTGATYSQKNPQTTASF